MKTVKTIDIVQMSLLASLSVILLLYVRLPIIPMFPFLEYDISDVPIIVSSLVFGLAHGSMMLFLICVIQAFILGGYSFIGFFMHFVSSFVFIFVISIIYKSSGSLKRLFFAMSVATLALVLIMLPMNYAVVLYVYGFPLESLRNFLLFGVIPFNFIKGLSDCIFSVVLFKIIRKLRRYPVLK